MSDDQDPDVLDEIELVDAVAVLEAHGLTPTPDLAGDEPLSLTRSACRRVYQRLHEEGHVEAAERLRWTDRAEQVETARELSRKHFGTTDIRRL